MNQIEPVLDAKYFHKSPINPQDTSSASTLPAKWLTGYGGKVAAPFNRFYMGGENDIRGFDIWGISPDRVCAHARPPSTCSTPTARRASNMVLNPATGVHVYLRANVTADHPGYQLVFPGGDTAGVGNARIPHSDFRTGHAGHIRRCRHR